MSTPCPWEGRASTGLTLNRDAICIGQLKRLDASLTGHIQDFIHGSKFSAVQSLPHTLPRITLPNVLATTPLITFTVKKQC